MKLVRGNETFTTDNENVISAFKNAGYEEVKEEAVKPSPKRKPTKKDE